MASWKSGYTVIAICVTMVTIALIAALVVTVTVGGTDPDVFLRFLAGPAIGNILTAGAITYLTIVNRKVTTLNSKVESVEQNTNGTNSALVKENFRLTQTIENHLKEKSE